MNYTPPSTTKIPNKRGIKIADYLYNRFLELFGTAEEIEEFSSTGEMSNKLLYINRVKQCKDGLLSIADYTSLMETIVANMPKRFSKRKAKQILQLIDFYIGPKLIEYADEEKRSSEGSPTEQLPTEPS